MAYQPKRCRPRRRRSPRLPAAVLLLALVLTGSWSLLSAHVGARHDANEGTRQKMDRQEMAVQVTPVPEPSDLPAAAAPAAPVPETPAPAQVDLSAFYTTESGKYEFGMVTLADAELAANVYPGLFDIAAEQCLPYINMMTMNTSEIVLVQVTNSSDVDKVKSILQSRIDAQVEGGAWYPSAIDAWQNNSRIVSNGNYIMMVVHESCDSIVSDFNALF